MAIYTASGSWSLIFARYRLEFIKLFAYASGEGLPISEAETVQPGREYTQVYVISQLDMMLYDRRRECYPC